MVSILTQHKQFIESLSEDQRFALKTYTGASSHIINSFLRGDKIQLSSVEKDWIQHLDTIFAMVPPLETAATVYRGIHGKSLDNFVTDNKTFLSTTRIKDTVQKFAGTPCCVLILTIPAGSKVLSVESLSYYNDEYEVILNRGGKFTVTGVKVGPQIEIFAMYMPEPSVSGFNSLSEIMNSVQLQFSKLFLDDLSQPQQKPSPVKKKELSLDFVPKGYVYHPFYKKNIPIDSEKNCGANRASIQKYDLSIKEQLGKICDFLPLSDIENILGPISYTEYRYKDLNICIFGERHDNTIQCTATKRSVTFNNFLQSILLEHQDIFYDFFFEIDYINSEFKARNQIMPITSLMYLIQTDLYNCFQNTKEKCQYRNLRAHYSDPRRYTNPGIEETIFLILLGMVQPTHDFIMKALENAMSIVSTNKLLLKEYAKSYLGQEIKTFIEKRVLKQADIILNSERVANIIGPLMIDIYSEIMNAYTLARMFRTFKSSSNQPPNIQNAILYVGEAHAIVIREFIETILELYPTISIGGLGCISTLTMKKSVLISQVKSSQEIKTIYHPFYEKIIPVNSVENCGENRASIQPYDPLVRNQLGRICDIHPLSDVEYILGPISYSEYRYKDLNLCIFGEVHTLVELECKDSLNKKSMTFNNFLQTLLVENKDTFYDFFFETSFINSENQNRRFISSVNFMFYLLGDSFYDCFQLNKGKCPFKNLRAHYVDNRDHTNRELVDTIISMNQSGKLPEIDNFFEKTFALIMDILTSNKLLLKEYSKSYLGQEIKSFIVARAQQMIDNLRFLFKDPTPKLHGFILIRMTSEIMNAYALSRIFRKFKPSLNQPEDIKNAIIYVGDSHAIVFRKFIETILGVKPTIKINGPSCIKTSDMRKSVLFR